MLAQKIFGPRKNVGPKKMLVQKIVVQKNVGSIFFCLMETNCNASACAKNCGLKDLPTMFFDFQKKFLLCIKVANRSIVQHMGNGHHLQHQRSSQKFWMEKLSKQCPMTYLTMFQASSVYKSFKWKLSAA